MTHEDDTTAHIDGHTYPYSSETGPAIVAENGGHYHEYQAIAEYADGHTHHMRGYTSIKNGGPNGGPLYISDNFHTHAGTGTQWFSII